MGETTPKYQPGDVVRLKSGGPPMTVAHVRDPQRTLTGLQAYGCVWFDGFDPKDNEFTEDVLVAVPNPPQEGKP